MGNKRGSRDPVNELFRWVRRRSMKVKAILGVIILITTLLILRSFVRNHNHFFIASEAIHAVGIMVLIYKLTLKNTCSGLSLKSQELTAIFLAVRLFCSYGMEQDIHTVLDFVTLISTLWVIYMIRYKLKSSYIQELDNFRIRYPVIGSALFAIIIHPRSLLSISVMILWAFCVYLESVSVLPQLRLMQNAKMVEPFTAHYVFALGVARFLGCAHWIIQIIDTRGKYLFFMGSGFFWPPAILLAEAVQTFILADFCYYYVKSIMDGQLLVRLPCPV
ncbi:ER lumen protein retaining receptor family protein [Tasmannia lanceolata]|uniref:ER lumen protein retaining receptor family protein n=1 Tax=Tasmannia lanceolata TaxID=3420 RepID=UPI004063DCC6